MNTYSISCRFRHAVIGLAAAMLAVPAALGQNVQVQTMQPAPGYAPAPGYPPPPAGVVDLMTASELEAVLAPIALYPDVLLAQVFTASTYPLDVVQAARWLRSNPDRSQLENQPWDPSVLALCNYPDVLYRLDQDLDWTNALGTAFLNQRQDVMNAVQTLRLRAQSAGVLQTTPQQTVVVQSGTVTIVPASPQVIYVPQYNPQVVYVEQPVYVQPAPLISFSAGFALGGWLDLDFDWGRRDVVWCRPGYWHGWAYHGHADWHDDWFTRVGPRRGFGDWDRHRDRGFDRTWRRDPHAPRPSYIGRFATRESRNTFALGIRSGDVNVGVRVSDRDRNHDWDRNRDNNWDRDRNRNGNRDFRGWDDNARGRDRGNDREGERRRTIAPRFGPAPTRDASNRGKESRTGDRVRATNPGRPSAANPTPRSTVRRATGGSAFSKTPGAQAKESSSRGRASRSGSHGHEGRKPK